MEVEFETCLECNRMFRWKINGNEFSDNAEISNRACTKANYVVLIKNDYATTSTIHSIGISDKITHHNHGFKI